MVLLGKNDLKFFVLLRKLSHLNRALGNKRLRGVREEVNWVKTA